MPLKTRIHKLLRSSERYFKTDMVYLAKGGSWLLSSQAIVTLLSFILSIAYANLLPQTSFGIYKYVLSLIGILAAFTLTGLGTSLVRSVARGNDATLKSAFWIEFTWTIGVTFLAGATALYYFSLDNITLGISLLVAGTLYPLWQGSGLFLSFLNGKKDFKTKSVYDVGYNIIPFAVILISLYLSDSPVVIITSYFASYTISALYFFYKTYKKYPGEESLDPETIVYGKHLSLMNVLGIVATNIDKVLIFHYLGAVKLAIYAFAIGPVSQISSLLKPLSVLAFPKLSGNDPHP